MEKINEKINENEEEYNNLFDYKYNDKIYNISIKLKKYIKNKNLNIFNIYNLDDCIYDFIKYNSVNYDNVIKEIDNKEDEYDLYNEDDIEY